MFNRGCCSRQMNGFGLGFGGGNNQQVECPVTEPVISKCVEKEFYHEVPQD